MTKHTYFAFVFNIIVIQMTYKIIYISYHNLLHYNFLYNSGNLDKVVTIDDKLLENMYKLRLSIVNNGT